MTFNWSITLFPYECYRLFIHTASKAFAILSPQNTQVEILEGKDQYSKSTSLNLVELWFEFGSILLFVWERSYTQIFLGSMYKCHCYQLEWDKKWMPMMPYFLSKIHNMDNIINKFYVVTLLDWLISVFCGIWEIFASIFLFQLFFCVITSWECFKPQKEKNLLKCLKNSSTKIFTLYII